MLVEDGKKRSCSPGRGLRIGMNSLSLQMAVISSDLQTKTPRGIEGLRRLNIDGGTHVSLLTDLILGFVGEWALRPELRTLSVTSARGLFRKQRGHDNRCVDIGWSHCDDFRRMESVMAIMMTER